MKRSELFFTALLIPLDAIMVGLAFFWAYQLRLNSGGVIFFWPFDQYLAFVGSLIPVWLIIFGLVGLYSLKKNRRAWEEFGSIGVGVSGGTFLVIAWPFLTHQEFFSRLVVIYIFFLALALVTLGRALARALKEFLYRYGVGVHRVMVIGTNGVAYQFVREIETNRNLGMRVVGLLTGGDAGQIHPELKPYPLLGRTNDIAEIVKIHPIDDLLIADPSLRRGPTLDLLEFAEDQGLSFKLSPSLLDVHATRIGVSELAGIPLLEYKRTPLEGWGMILKRTVDVVGALIGLIILSPIMFLVALAVKATSRGPIIYKNERVGDNGHFLAYKFRSMRVEYSVGDEYGGDQALKLEQKLIKKHNTRNGPLYKIGNDPRLTPIGQFIRVTSLDELPQLWNILRGEMSLVGPRPHQPREVDQYEQRHRKLLQIKPGLTGLAQVSGRSDLDFEQEFRLDAYYIENWSLWLDLEILLRTPAVLLTSRDRKAA